MAEKQRRRRLLLSSALAALAGVVASWSYAGRVSPWTDMHDEYLTATTDDGFTLPLYRFRPVGAAQPVPVILCHGLGANRYNMMAAGGANLATWLARKGHDLCAFRPLSQHRRQNEITDRPK